MSNVFTTTLRVTVFTDRPVGRREKQRTSARLKTQKYLPGGWLLGKAKSKLKLQVKASQPPGKYASLVM